MKAQDIRKGDRYVVAGMIRYTATDHAVVNGLEVYVPVVFDDGGNGTRIFDVNHEVKGIERPAPRYSTEYLTGAQDALDRAEEKIRTALGGATGNALLARLDDIRRDLGLDT